MNAYAEKTGLPQNYFCNKRKQLEFDYEANKVSNEQYSTVMDLFKQIKERGYVGTTKSKSKAKKTWIFNLRKGVKFHDGSPFTADDVIATMQRAPNVPKSPSSFSAYVRGKVVFIFALFAGLIVALVLSIALGSADLPLWMVAKTLVRCRRSKGSTRRT